MTNNKKIDEQFIATVWEYYKYNRRDLPWRNLSEDFRQRTYQVVVSELMLQQTQVARVIVKYEEWMHVFPTLHDASSASLADILGLWSGLGYNRRAQYLQHVLRTLHHRQEHELLDGLTDFKGIGPNTAGAIYAYVCNQPSVFIETNIRTVFIHHYFSHLKRTVSDGEIMLIVKRVVDAGAPREWYWALMDYGTHIKKTVSINHLAKAHKKQSVFAGSERQLRGKIIIELLNSPKSLNELWSCTADNRLQKVLLAMKKENLIRKIGDQYAIYDDTRLE